MTTHNSPIVRFAAMLIPVLLFTGLSTEAQARMYEWVDPNTGSLQMSGEPPSWYRGNANGPRVRVFDQGVVVDDTTIEVTEAQGQALREEAFRQFESSQALQALTHMETEAIKTAERDEVSAETGDINTDDFEQSDPQGPPSISERTIDQLKELLDQWDQINFQ